jgi:gamma-D-glutamyl-L-lysine dipeptidyl-peptidase
MRCAVDVAPVRADPNDEAEQVTQLVRAEPVRVKSKLDGWAQVVTAYEYPGWVRASALEDGEGSLASGAEEPLAAARAFLGARYEWGGMTASGIDCSGLVHMAFRASGHLVPRDSWQQEAAGSPVTAGLELPGDIVVYGGPDRADHVAFWLGEGRILHSTARDGLGVVEEAEPAELAERRRGVVRLIPR